MATSRSPQKSHRFVTLDGRGHVFQTCCNVATLLCWLGLRTCRAQHGHTTPVTNGRENRILSRVIRWLDK
eukprot:314573-Pyramimonas_sp.AAC.1